MYDSMRALTYDVMRKMTHLDAASVGALLGEPC
jgi:hypothetical protein